MTFTRHSLNELGFVGRGRSRHRPRNAPHLYGGPYPFIQTGDIKAAGLRLTSHTQTYSEVGLEQSKMWPAGTLCITIAANIAESAILGIDACFPDSVVGFRADDSKCDTRYIKYVFDITKAQYQQVSQGATQDNLSLEKLLSFPVDLPPLPTQHRIADILSAYDDAIENNRRRIKLLEDAARYLYEEWFVRLRFPGHEHVRIKNGVPEGWERVPFEDALVLQRGFDLPARLRKEGEIPIYASTGVTGRHNEAKVKGPGIVTGRSGSLGMVSYAPTDFWPLNTALWVREFRRVGPLFAYFMLQKMRLEQYNGGASVPTLDRNAVHRVNVTVPSRQLLGLFDEYAKPAFQQKTLLETQNGKFAAARDHLLPKLMSGEIAA